MSTAELIREAEARRDHGVALAVERRPERALLGELALLDALLASPDGTATADDIADDPRLQYQDGGRWVGGVTLRLLRAGLITEAGVVRSVRPSRHRGRTGLYRLTDRAAAEHRRAELRRLLTAAAGTAQPTLY